MFPNFSLGERDGRSYSALWPQVGVGHRKQRWRPCDGENSSQKARLGYAFILWGFLAKLKDAGFLTALISAVFGGRYCGCRGLGGRSNGRKANDQTSLPTVAGRTAQLGPCHQGISDIVVTSVWLPSKCCPIKITDIWQRSDVRKRRLYDHLPLRFFEDARKAGTKWWFLARLSCLLVPFFLVWFVWWLGGFLHIFYFHPENWERCSPILTTFAYFFRWVGGEKPPTRLRCKKCEARKAGDRTLTSFVLRHCSEIFKGAVHRVTFSDFGPRKDRLRFVTKKNLVVEVSYITGRKSYALIYIYEDF